MRRGDDVAVPGHFDDKASAGTNRHNRAESCFSAGQRIENTFIRGLVRLEPGLGKLSVGFEKVVQSFLKNDMFAKWLDEADSALETFATYIGKSRHPGNVT
jgi:hypothetical protein